MGIVTDLTLKTRLARRVWLFGLPLVDAGAEETAAALAEAAVLGRPQRVAFVNAHCINVRSADPAYAAALASADLLLPDGSGMNLAARLTGQRFTANLNGTDLFPLLCAQMAARGQSLYLLGGQPGVAAAVAEGALARHPGLRIAGSRDGYFTQAETEAVLAGIRAARPDCLLVAFGVPKQDVWLARHAAALQVPLMLGVGGLFDFMAKRIPRAPRWLRALGLEWSYRLLQEPKRMARRYLLGNPIFVAQALAQGLAQRLFKHLRSPDER